MILYSVSISLGTLFLHPRGLSVFYTCTHMHMHMQACTQNKEINTHSFEEKERLNPVWWKVRSDSCKLPSDLSTEALSVNTHAQ